MNRVLIIILGTFLLSACGLLKTTERVATPIEDKQKTITIPSTLEYQKITPAPSETNSPTISPTPYPPMKPEIAAGDYHTCYLTARGSVMCWGWNRYGQAGVETSNQVMPGHWLDLPQTRQISAGGYHSCAVTIDHKVYCWGRNNTGQLGNASINNSTEPLLVEGLENVKIDTVVCGSLHTCAYESSGNAWCWGSNRDGKLGAGIEEPFSTIPNKVAVPAIDIISMSAGATFTCAVGENGQTWCWGDGSFGQTGSEIVENITIPQEISKVIPEVKYLSSGWFHTCALTNSGGLACWGKNYEGELGNSSTVSRAEAVSVTELTEKKTTRLMSIGGRSGCAVTTDNGLYCWGKNDHGQVGNGTTRDQLFPMLIETLEDDIISLSVGASHACYLTNMNTLWCWGANDHLQLGTSTPENATIPIQIEIIHE